MLDVGPYLIQNPENVQVRNNMCREQNHLFPVTCLFPELPPDPEYSGVPENIKSEIACARSNTAPLSCDMLYLGLLLDNSF